MTVVDLSVYAIADPGVCGRAGLVARVLDAVAGGASLVQYRDKSAGPDALIETAAELKQALDGSGVPLLVNDRVDVALACGADGVHLGQADMAPAEARALLGRDAIIGLTIKSAEDADRAPLEVIDYACIGGVFATASKANPDPPIGLDGLGRLCRRLRARGAPWPIGAIAGITAHNAGSVIDAGADGVAVISQIFAADDVTVATAELARVVKAGLARRRVTP